MDDISVSSVSDSDLTDYEIIREIEEVEKDPEVSKDAELMENVSKDTEMTSEALEEKKPDKHVSESSGSTLPAETSVTSELSDQTSS